LRTDRGASEERWACSSEEDQEEEEREREKRKEEAEEEEEVAPRKLQIMRRCPRIGYSDRGPYHAVRAVACHAPKRWHVHLYKSRPAATHGSHLKGHQASQKKSGGTATAAMVAVRGCRTLQSQRSRIVDKILVSLMLRATCKIRN